MKTKVLMLRWLMLLLLFGGVLQTWAQVGSLTIPGNESVCLNSTHDYGVVLNPNTATYTWSIIPASGGTIIPGATPNLISVLWNNVGTYTLRIVETNTSGCVGPNNDIQVTVNPLPVIALTGPSPVCLNSAGNIYTTDPGMTAYVWTVTGGTITAGGNATSNTVTVTWDGVGPYSVSVNYADPNGCSATNPTIFPVTVNPLPVVALTGPSPVCLNSVGNIYTTDPGMTAYVWTVTGGTITAGGNATSNTVTVTWDGVGPYSVNVNYTNPNGCSATNPTVLPVTVNPLPVVALTGPSPVCLNSTGNIYTTDPGMTAYVWTVIGGTITAGGNATSNTVSVTWDGIGPYSVSVNYTNPNGCSATNPTVLLVTVNPLPVVALTGPSPVCLNSIGNIYTTDPGMTAYVWTVTGGTITAGGNATSNTVSVTWDGIGPYSVSVNYTNPNGCSATNPTVLLVTVNPLPVVALTGPSPVCLNSTGNIYTTDPGMTAYVWTVIGGTITAGGNATSNTVTVTWDGVGPYSVSVNYTNPNGCSATNPTVLPVTVNPLPVVALTGPSPVCLNSTGNIYTTDPGMTAYVWTVIGGTITAGGNATSNTVTVTWDGVGPYSVSVNYTNPNGCSATNPTVLPVTVNPLPVVALTGPSPVCLNSTGNIYTTDPGMTAYVWTVIGGTITAGGNATSNTVTVTWDGVGPYSVSVNYSNPNGCSATNPTVLPVIVNPLPATSPIWHN